MNKLFFILLLLINIFVTAQTGQASIRNPFEPQLPKIEQQPQTKKPEKAPKPVKEPRTRDTEKPKETHLMNDIKAPIKINPPALTVSGIIWNSDRPQAIINNQVVDIGDSIEEATIMDIQKTEIRISYQGQNFSVTP